MVHLTTVVAVVGLIKDVATALDVLNKKVPKAINACGKFTSKVKALIETVKQLDVIRTFTELELSERLRNQSQSMVQLLEGVKQLTDECSSVAWWKCIKRKQYLDRLVEREDLLRSKLKGLHVALNEELQRMQKENERLQKENERLQKQYLDRLVEREDLLRRELIGLHVALKEELQRIPKEDERLQKENERLQEENSLLKQMVERPTQANARDGILIVVPGLNNIVQSTRTGIHYCFRWIQGRGGAVDIE